MDKLDPAVQARAKRLCVGTILNDFDKARELVPLAKVEASDGVIAAENVFGTLMQGQQCVPRKGIDQQGYIGTLLKYMANVVQRILSTDGVGTMDEVVGLATVAQNISQHIIILAADKAQKPLVKQMGDALGQILNQVKAIGQRLMEKHQSQSDAQNNPEGAAKAQSTIMMAQTKMKINEANAALKQKQKALDFALDQQRQQLALAAEIERENLKAHTDASHATMAHIVDLVNEMRMSEAKAHAIENAPKKPVDNSSET